MVILLTACSPKTVYIDNDFPEIKVLKEIPTIKITTNKDGGLSAKNSIKLFKYAKAIKVSDAYHRKEIIRYNTLRIRRIESRKDK